MAVYGWAIVKALCGSRVLSQGYRGMLLHTRTFTGNYGRTFYFSSYFMIIHD
jgi:hypothetical protein